jgi:hypothetical protein
MAIKTVHDRFESNGTSVTFMNLSYVVVSQSELSVIFILLYNFSVAHIICSLTLLLFFRISSQSLMAKSKCLWEDVVILVDESDTESERSECYQGGEEGTTLAGDRNNDDTEVGTNTVSSSTALPPPILPPMVKAGRAPTTTWEGVSVFGIDDVETVESGALSGGGQVTTSIPDTTPAAAVAAAARSPGTPGEQSGL